MPASDGDLQTRAARILREEVAPVLEMDGGAIEVLAVEAGVVQVRLRGACSSCPGSIMTVLMGIEQELRRRLPEIEYLEAVP